VEMDLATERNMDMDVDMDVGMVMKVGLAGDTLAWKPSGGVNG
jgi:hypothetical protein